MNLAQAIQALYPEASPGPNNADFEVRDDGDGPYLHFWNDELGKKPSEEELEEGWKQHLASQKSDEVLGSVVKRAPQIIQQAQGEYGGIGRNEMSAFTFSLALWVLNRAAKDAGLPHDGSLDEQFLNLHSNYLAKQEELKAVADDPDATAQDISQIDPSV